MKRRECLECSVTLYPELHGDSGNNAPGPVAVHGGLVRFILLWNALGKERKRKEGKHNEQPCDSRIQSASDAIDPALQVPPSEL